MQNAECRSSGEVTKLEWRTLLHSAFYTLHSAFLLGCGGSSQLVLPAAGATPDDRLSEVVTAALEADARLESPDTLYAVDAEIIADGMARTGAPRYAGIGTGGSVAVTSSRLEVRGTVAWARLEYRWVPGNQGVVREGRATFVLSPNEKGAWLIRHAHSSSPDR